jgi:hypothetical protein
MKYHCPECGGKLHALLENDKAIYLYCMTCSDSHAPHRFFFCKRADRVMSEKEYRNVVK